MQEHTRVEILLESLNDKVDILGEGVVAIQGDMVIVKDRLTGVETRLTGVETQLTSVETRLTGVEDEQRLMRLALIEDSYDVELLKRLHPNMKHI